MYRVRQRPNFTLVIDFIFVEWLFFIFGTARHVLDGLARDLLQALLDLRVSTRAVLDCCGWRALPSSPLENKEYTVWTRETVTAILDSERGIEA